MFGLSAERSARASLGARAGHTRIAGLLSAAQTYPLFVDGFHLAVGPPGGNHSVLQAVFAAILLVMMFAVPMTGFLSVLRDSARIERATSLEVRTRRLAYSIVAVPTLYCLLGVCSALVSSLFPDEVAWATIWLVGEAIAYHRTPEERWSSHRSPSPILRFAHGASALILLAFVAFHLTNHLFAWSGERAHATVMEWGRLA